MRFLKFLKKRYKNEFLKLSHPWTFFQWLQHYFSRQIKHLETHRQRKELLTFGKSFNKSPAFFMQSQKHPSKATVWYLEMLINLHVNDYFASPFPFNAHYVPLWSHLTWQYYFLKGEENVIVICSLASPLSKRRAPLLLIFLAFKHTS